MSELYIPRGGGVDASIPLGAKAPAAGALGGSPIDSLTNLMRFQLLTNQNALFQQEFGAKQKMGAIASQSMNQDGSPNYDKMFSGWLSDPQTAAFAGPVINNIRQAELTNLQSKGLTIDQAQKYQAMVFDGVANAWNNPTRDGVETALMQTGAALPPGNVRDAYMARAVDIMKTFPKGEGGAEPDPTAVRTWMQPIVQQQKNTFDSLSALAGKPDLTNVGGQLHFTRLHPINGVTEGGVAFNKTLDPGQASEVVQNATPTGQPAFKGNMPGVPGAVPAPALQPGQSIGGQTAPVPPAPTPAKAPSPTTPQGFGLTPAQAGEQETGGKAAGELYDKGLPEAMHTITNLNLRIQEEQRLMQEFKQGGGADVRGQLAKLGQAFGLPNEVVDAVVGAPPGKPDAAALAALQTYESLIASQALEQLKQDQGGVGRTAYAEVAQYQKSYPNVTRDPRSVAEFYNFMNKLQSVVADKQQAWSAWKAGDKEALGKMGLDSRLAGDPTQFDPAWNKHLVTSKILDFSPKPSVLAPAGAPGGGKSSDPLGDLLRARGVIK